MCLWEKYFAVLYKREITFVEKYTVCYRYSCVGVFFVVADTRLVKFNLPE